jgi:hypothetical protein
LPLLLPLEPDLVELEGVVLVGEEVLEGPVHAWVVEVHTWGHTA